MSHQHSDPQTSTCRHQTHTDRQSERHIAHTNSLLDIEGTSGHPVVPVSQLAVLWAYHQPSGGLVHSAVTGGQEEKRGEKHTNRKRRGFRKWTVAAISNEIHCEHMLRWMLDSKTQKKLMVCRFWRVKTGRFSVTNRLLSTELIVHIPVCWNDELIHPQSHEQLLTDTGHVFMLAHRTTDTQEVRGVSTNHPKRWDRQCHTKNNATSQSGQCHRPTVNCDWHRSHNMQHCKVSFLTTTSNH